MKVSKSSIKHEEEKNSRYELVNIIPLHSCQEVHHTQQKEFHLMIQIIVHSKS